MRFGLHIKAPNDIGKDLIIALLLYAYDLAIMTESEEELQSLLNFLQKLYKQWHMRVNIKKSKIVHVRTKTQPMTDLTFMFKK